MHGFVQNIETLSLENEKFRHVIYTAPHCQLVLMALKPGEDIGVEIHAVDQFFRIESGVGEVILNQKHSAIEGGTAIVVPAGTEHNIVNTGSRSMKLYTVYAPPHHKDGTVHFSKKDALNDHEHFDGKTTQ